MIEFYICVDCISSIHNCTTLSTFASSLSLSVIAGDGIGFVYIIWCVCVCACIVFQRSSGQRELHTERTLEQSTFFVFIFGDSFFFVIVSNCHRSICFYFRHSVCIAIDSISPKRLIYCSSMKLIWFLCKFFVDSDF